MNLNSIIRHIFVVGKIEVATQYSKGDPAAWMVMPESLTISNLQEFRGGWRERSYKLGSGSLDNLF